MNTKTRIIKLEKTRKPKGQTAQVVIYRVGDPFKASAANVTIFIPDNLRDKVTK